MEAFTAGLSTSRDRAMVLLMLLGGLRAAEVVASGWQTLTWGCAGSV